MRILYVVHQFLPRHRAGTELYTYYLAREMMRRGHELAIYTTEIDPERHQHRTRWHSYEGLPVFEAVHNHVFPSFRHTYRNEEMEAHFERVLKETRADLVHFQHLHLHSIGYIDIAAQLGLPMVYTLHEYLLMCPRMGQLLLPELEPCPGPEPARCAQCVADQVAPGPEEIPLAPAPEDGAGWSGEALADLPPHPHLEAVVRRRQEIARRLRKVNLFISPSRFLRQRFIDEGLIEDDRILFSDNGFPVELFERREREPSSSGLRVGFVGTIAEFKGVHLLVEAMAGIDDPEVSCQIHGALDTFPDYKERLLAMPGIERVELHGAFEHGEIGRILSGIDVLVVPSLWFENSPLTIHEAFLAGVPVLASDRGGMAELVNDGENGLHFRRGDVEDLREKILRLRQEPGLLGQLRKFPSLKTIVDDAEDMEGRYERLLSDTGGEKEIEPVLQPREPLGRTMKILHVVSSYLPEATGGTQLQLYQLAREQQRLGHEVVIFARTGGNGEDDFELLEDEWDGMPVFRLVHNFQDCDRFEKLYTHPTIDRRFRQFLERVSPDLVHVHHLTCLSTSMVEEVKRLGLPLVMWLSDFWLQCPRGQRVHPETLTICENLDRSRCVPCLQKLWPHHLGDPPAPGEAVDPNHSAFEKLAGWDAHMARMLDLADVLLTPSAFHRDRFVETGVPKERFRVLTYGLPKDDLLAEPRGKQAIRRIGYIGSVIPSKGVHTLVEAFARLGRDELELDIYGEIVPFHEKRDYLEELQAMVPSGLEVRFHGRFENQDLPQLFESMDLLVVPSLWWESYCLTAREGALAGLPVVASDLAGLSEAVDQGLVLGFEPDNPEDLARVLARVCDEPDLREELTHQAHKVRPMKACAAEMEEVYRGVLGERASPKRVTLFIPTWNAGPEFSGNLAAMLDQDYPGELEVLVIDSGSTDGTAEFLRKQPVRLLEIPNGEYNHGLTRNLGIQEATGDVVVLTVQDARPKDRHWLRRLVECFDDPRVAGAYSGQVARPEASPFIKERLRHWAAAGIEPRVQEVESIEAFESLEPLEKLGRVAFDNVSSSVRRQVALEIPFRERQFGEDLDWGHRAILAGHRIVFEPRSQVVHSHDNSIWYETKRVYLDHQNLHRLFGVATVPHWRDVITCTRLGSRHLQAVVEAEEDLGALGKLWWKAKALPFSLGQNLGQYLGVRSVWRLRQGDAVHRMLDAVMRRGV